MLVNPFLSLLAGAWCIVSTNFPMWLKGDKTAPAFTYTVTEKNGKAVLYDEVSYLKKGKPHTLRGYDHPGKENDSAFVWRGTGLLYLVKSHWEVRMMDEEQQWAVIWFSRTLFTPEGVDIIHRDRHPGPEVIANIRSRMQEDPLLRSHIASLRDL